MTDRTPHITYIVETRTQHRRRLARAKAKRSALIALFILALFTPDKLMGSVTGGVQTVACQMSAEVSP